MPAVFANSYASRSQHISSRKIARLRLKQNLVYPVILSDFFGKKPITLTFAKAMYVVSVWRFAILEEKLFHAPDPEVFELF